MCLFHSIDIKFLCLKKIRIVPPKIAPFTFGEEPLNQDEPASVTCMISGGDLPINVIFMFNRSPIDTSHDVVIEKRGKRIYVLIIEATKAKHAGNYSCLAENAAGIVEHMSRLIVNGLP